MDSRAASKKIHIGPANALASYQPVLMTHLLTPLVNWKCPLRSGTAFVTKALPTSTSGALTTIIIRLVSRTMLQMLAQIIAQFETRMKMGSLTTRIRIWAPTKRMLVRCLWSATTLTSMRELAQVNHLRSTAVLTVTVGCTKERMRGSALWSWRRRLTCIYSPWRIKKRNWCSQRLLDKMTYQWITQRVTHCSLQWLTIVSSLRSLTTSRPSSQIWCKVRPIWAKRIWRVIRRDWTTKPCQLGKRAYSLPLTSWTLKLIATVMVEFTQRSSKWRTTLRRSTAKTTALSNLFNAEWDAWINLSNALIILSDYIL